MRDINFDISGQVAVITGAGGIICGVMAREMAKKGAKVALAQNGRQAVERFAASKPGEFDLILMDIMMPVLNGLEATRRIRAMERSDAAEIPIFAMPANAFAEDIALSREAGVNEHVPKPLDFEQLAVLIHRYCAKKE